MALLSNASPDEAKAARSLVNLILKKGYQVSVNDGCEWVLRRSTSLQDILSVLCTTSEDHLILRDASGEKVGVFYLVWGNSGEELVCDYSANAVMEGIWSEWQEQVVS
jgi:hypothetical protein